MRFVTPSGITPRRCSSLVGVRVRVRVRVGVRVRVRVRVRVKGER